MNSRFLTSINVPLARIALFVVYFWFGILKLFNDSPASPLVHDLFNKTIPSFVPFGLFMTLFALFEMLIGIMFLIPRLDKWTFAILLLHLFTTALPLLLLPAHTWSGWFIPTLEGQYIIKNIVLLSLAVMLVTRTDTRYRLP